MSNYNRSLAAFMVSARVVIRTYAARLRRQALLTNGASLVAQMLRIALDKEIPLWTESPLEELIVEDGAVVGVRTMRDGVPVSVRARKGVVLASGGFAHNPRDARGVRRRPAKSRALVDLESGRHRRGHPDGNAPSEPRPTSWTRPGGCPHRGLDGSGSRPWTKHASGLARSTSMLRASAS